MTQLYQMLNGMGPALMQTRMPQMQGQVPNMFQRIGEFMQAMRNPVAYIMNRFPDVPAEMSNDPNRILSYLQQTRNIPNEQIQQYASNSASIMRQLGLR